MSYELIGAFSVEQAKNNAILEKYLDDFVTVYLNDYLIFSEKKDQHQKHVRKVLTRCLKNEIRFNLKKCQFHVREAEFLKHIISSNKMRMSLNKIKSVMK